VGTPDDIGEGAGLEDVSLETTNPRLRQIPKISKWGKTKLEIGPGSEWYCRIGVEGNPKR
jgi:hypothetical protein